MRATECCTRNNKCYSRWITPHLGADICVWGRPSCQGLWRDPNVNGHLEGGGGYLPDPCHGSNDTHLLGILPMCRHAFCLENGCYNQLLQRNCQMSKQNREINNLITCMKGEIQHMHYNPQISDFSSRCFQSGLKKKKREEI